MNIRLMDIDIVFKKAHERIEFADFNYFYGQMGAGKSTIARLIDFCLGGDMGEAEMTPALQAEFVSVSLSLVVVESPLIIERNAHSDQVRVQWSAAEEQCEVMIPTRTAAGEVLPGAEVEVLSDLIYYLAGKTPPKVRRSKIKEDSDLERLSLRDLLWYCYLDQDSMDSSFFHLDGDANQWKRLKSRDVLRFLVGFHQEQVAELEVKLELVRAEKLKCEAGASAIRDALNSVDIVSEDEFASVRRIIESDIQESDRQIAEARDRTRTMRSHAMETLQGRARLLSSQITELLNASSDIRDTIANDRTHRNELLALATRFRRSQSAKEVLNGVDFVACPRCGNELPPRSSEICPVCGQVHSDTPSGIIDEKAAEQDLKSRVGELAELISRHETQLHKFDRRLSEMIREKAAVDADLTRVSVDYDSAYLSAVLEAEKHRSALQQKLLDLGNMEVLVRQMADFSRKLHDLATTEQGIRSELKDARQRAEKDTQNLARLKRLFLDCLLKAKIPGFLPDDIVEMKPPHFLPEVTSAAGGDLAVTSFTNLGSGGKKTLFKCCFAVAVHRLAVEVDALLPTLLVIDSPMKNISERENRVQFEGFFEMLYALCDTELKGTQFILIDKELCPPPNEFQSSFLERHMKPDDDEYPPLIRYYRGK